MGRVLLPNYPHHVVQRGHNRQAVFAGEADFRRYLDDLRELKTPFDVRLHAYCSMTNHIHLLLSPGEAVTGMGQLMKALAARATRYRNKLEGRSGTLWESRYKSSPVQTEQYLFACSRYIELNPVRACMVNRPEDYHWSSYRQRLGIETDRWIDYDPCYLGLAITEAERRQLYRRYILEAVPEEELGLIRQAVQRGQLTGNNRFIDEVGNILGRRVEFRAQGRPAKGCEKA
jgi:putative transposase